MISYSLKLVQIMLNRAAVGGNHAAKVDPTIANDAASTTVLVVSFTVLFRLWVSGLDGGYMIGPNSCIIHAVPVLHIELVRDRPVSHPSCGVIP